MAILNFTLILFVAVICQRAWTEDGTELDKIHNECLAEHNITESELKHMDKLSPDKTNVDIKVKCFAHCVMKKRGYLDENDKLEADKFPNTEVINDCKAMHDMTDDPCEYVFDVFNCIQE